MNLRFKELSLEAGLAVATIDDLPGSVLVALDKDGNRIDPNLALNAFADSLIAECIKVLKESRGDSEPVSTFTSTIHSHFGTKP